MKDLREVIFHVAYHVAQNKQETGFEYHEGTVQLLTTEMDITLEWREDLAVEMFRHRKNN